MLKQVCSGVIVITKGTVTSDIENNAHNELASVPIKIILSPTDGVPTVGPRDGLNWSICGLENGSASVLRTSSYLGILQSSGSRVARYLFPKLARSQTITSWYLPLPSVSFEM